MSGSKTVFCGPDELPLVSGSIDPGRHTLCPTCGRHELVPRHRDPYRMPVIPPDPISEDTLRVPEPRKPMSLRTKNVLIMIGWLSLAPVFTFAVANIAVHRSALGDPLGLAAEVAAVIVGIGLLTMIVISIDNVISNRPSGEAPG